MSDAPAPKSTPKRSWQAPKGTRDFYPEDLLRRRYIIDSWRRTALRHGFEEIDGPTFEESELYTVKSGEGILNELFGAYSGKDPRDVEQVRSGPPPFALRPEFTPTLARMYAAKARQLPQPTKWFCVSNFFRAERPQRGRLREFWQWNCDVIGETSHTSDIETISCAVDVLLHCGLTPGCAVTKFNNRQLIERTLNHFKVPGELWGGVYALMDLIPKISEEEAQRRAEELGLQPAVLVAVLQKPIFHNGGMAITHSLDEFLGPFSELVIASGLDGWMDFDPCIVRGLAYYTGTVFELIAEGERAVAGGGRYDKLIELFGPCTGDRRPAPADHGWVPRRAARCAGSRCRTPCRRSAA